MKIFLKKSQDLLKSNLVFQNHEDFFIISISFSPVVDNPHIPVETENQTAVSSSFFALGFLSSLNTEFSKQRLGLGQSPPIGKEFEFFIRW